MLLLLQSNEIGCRDRTDDANKIDIYYSLITPTTKKKQTNSFDEQVGTKKWEKNKNQFRCQPAKESATRVMCELRVCVLHNCPYILRISIKTKRMLVREKR